jgi:superfamily II DNA or RNA helicase
MDRTKQIELQNKFSKEIWTYLSNKYRGCVDIAQRVGKTFIAGNIIKTIPEQKILIAFPDNQIISSWELAFRELKINTENLILTNFSSLKKYLDIKWFLFIIDEIHDAGSEKELENVGTIINNSQYSLGMSGTLSEDTKTRIWDLFGMKVFLTYSAEQAIQDGIISDYQITIHKAYLDDVVKTKNKQGKLLTEKKKFDNYTFIIEKMKREKKNFMFLALQRNSLAQKSIGKRKKCLELLKQLKDKRVLVFTGYSEQADSLGIPSFHSKSKDDNMLSFNNLEFNHLALANMGRIGKSYLNLDSIILLSWTGNEEDVFQRVSRAMLLDYKSKIADIHLICIQEKSETKKLEKALSLLDQNKIKWNT